ncbi:MAG: NAD(P)H-dependent oxidoreductase subunit E [Clostridia bacterium]|nr:NAD(P)H-dependent oxidoreductase subunit E [Clostridia bacterium]
MEQKIDFTVLDQAINEYGNQEKSLIAILQRAQENFRYLPREIFPYLAEKLGIPEARIYGVATFYENFSLEAKGKYVIKVCDGTACHVRRSIPVLNELKKLLNLKEGQKTTQDLMFTVETVSCLGACGLAPVMMVNEEVYPAMTPDKVREVIKSIKESENV